MANEEKMSLIKKLANIRAIAEVVKKDKKGFNYSYTDITEILAKVTAGMKKYGVSLIPSIVPGTSEITQNVVHNTKFDKSGNTYDQTVTEMLFKAEMIFKWIDDENTADFIEVPWVVTGSQGDPSQALGSGLTYCTRYFLCNFFQIAQPETDVDAYRSKQKAAEESEDTAAAKGIVEEFDKILRNYLADNADQSETVKKFISRFAKNANYLAIKDPALAAKLLEEFKKKFLNNE